MSHPWARRHYSTQRRYTSRMPLPNPRPHHIFVGSSTEANALSIQLADQLDDAPNARVSHWLSSCQPGDVVIERLEEIAHSCDYAVFVATSEDALLRRGEAHRVTRDNVVLEFGLFVGSIGRKRTILVIPDDSSTSLPSDLQGVAVEYWRTKRRSDPVAAMRPVAERLSRKFGQSPHRGGLRSQFIDLAVASAPGNSVTERLASARQEVHLSGNDCKFVIESRTSDLRAALNRGVRVKVLCADPEIVSVAEMLAAVDQRFKTAEAFQQSMISVEAVLRDLRSDYPGLFEFRYMPVLPSLEIFIIDPEVGGSTKIELYPPKPYLPGDSRPHILIDPLDHRWVSYFRQAWENYWSMSRIPEV